MTRSRSRPWRLPTLLLAVVAAVGVANTYYLQPLLHLVSVRLDLTGGTAGFLVTVTQAGFVLGLATLLPLGDLHSRRWLIVVALLGAAVFDGLAGVAGSALSLGAALVGVGIFSVVAQLAVTYVAAAAPPATRATEIGKVMAGLLAGIVLARTYAGWLADLAGYHAVFLVAAIVSVLLVGVVLLRLPEEPTKSRMRLGQLFADTWRLVRAEPLLRLRSALGFLSFGAFSMFWTTMAFALAGTPYHLDAGVIGLFGFAGLAGVLSARVVGMLADRGHTALTTIASFALIAGSWLGFVVDHHQLLAFIVLTATLDAGIQGAQLSNQSLIYLLAPGSQGRITMVYMIAYFLGGVAGSAAGSVLVGIGGFHLVAIAGVGVGIVGIAIWASVRAKERRWVAAARDALVASA